VGIPVIASGGAGTVAHFADVFSRGRHTQLWQQAFSIWRFHFAFAQRGAGAGGRTSEASMLIPSIDLLGGRIVQLVQGEKLRLAFDDFEYWIERFSRFPLVQLIDLDAAMRQGENSRWWSRLPSGCRCKLAVASTRWSGLGKYWRRARNA